MLHPGIKRLAVFLMLLEIFLLGTGRTDADIFAERIVKSNRFSMISLDFTVRNTFNDSPLGELFHTPGIVPGGFDLGAARLQTQTERSFNYRLRTEFIGGDRTLCERLRLKIVSRNFSEIYSGGLLDLSVDSRFVGPSVKDYIFFLSLEDEESVIMNKSCQFNIEIKSFRSDPSEQGGIFARRVINNYISSGSW